MPEALRLFETGSHDDPQDTSAVLGKIIEVFGEVDVLDNEPSVDEDPFEPILYTRFINASPSNLNDGSAQRVPPCGDQTPAYLGEINGPKGILDDDTETPPLM
ncbi:hypothetical protein H6800_03080 [Candidatus Nomurabacteria bacterium]|nr:hypothetical protein [Candidatus Nomurabacteria bacterium]